MRKLLSTFINKLRATHMKITTEANIHQSLSLKLPDLNQRFTRVNSGGCGLIAFNLARKLRKHNIPANVVIVGSIDGPGMLTYTRSWIEARLDTYDVKDISELTLKIVDLMTDEDSSPKRDLPNGHLCVEVFGKLYDATGDVSYEYIDISGPITDEAMTAMLAKRDLWNPTFNDYNNDRLPEILELIETIANETATA